MELFLITFSALFSIVNPFGAMPVFLALTSNDTKEWRNAQAKKACIFVVIVLVIFFLVGSYILNFFNISIEGMRIAGGIIISKSGMDLLSSGSQYEKGRSVSKKVKREAILKNDISFSPLAMPLLAGPGSISLLISMALDLEATFDYFIIIGAIIALGIITFILLLVSPKIMEKMGESGASALTRMIGFIVLAIGIQFIANGVFPMIDYFMNN